MFILRVIRALDAHKVGYAIVGGFAVALHGAVRGTVDVDIVLNLARGSYLAAEKAFRALGLESRLPLSAGQVFDFREEYIANKNLIAWSFYNPLKASEILDVIITHDLKKMKTVSVAFHGLNLRVLDLDSLIRMKSESGRPQDLEDIQALRTIKG